MPDEARNIRFGFCFFLKGYHGSQSTVPSDFNWSGMQSSHCGPANNVFQCLASVCEKRARM